MTDKKQQRRDRGDSRDREIIHEDRRESPRRDDSILGELPTGLSKGKKKVEKRLSSVKPPKAQQ